MPGEKLEFSFLIHEIIVLPIKLSWQKKRNYNNNNNINIVILVDYVGAIRTPNSKYQKFMTYRLVDNIQ